MSGGPPPKGRLGEWLDRRVGWRKLMHETLDEPVPGGARWAYVFGSGLLFILANQVITGMFLALYYVPSPDHAHTTVSFIQKQVAGGAFLRSLHRYGSSFMVVLLLLHLGQTVVYGAYKSRRELLWLMGCLLFLLVLAMSFTGYLLPWDQSGYAATAVATNMISEVPLVGNGIKILLRGGTELGALTLTRFFALHVLMFPGLIIGAVLAHVFLFRKAGAAGPPLSDEARQALPAKPFFPGQVLRDFAFGLAIVGLLFALAIWQPAGLGPRANPNSPTYVPRPEWFFLPLFQWLKYWHGPASVIGIVVTPALLVLLLFSLPFIDRSPERHPFRRPLILGGATLLLGGLVGLGVLSRLDDRQDPAVAKKLAAQAAAERRLAHTPFAPDELLAAGASPASPHVQTMTPLEAKGALLFGSESCAECHSVGSKGSEDSIKLSDLDRHFPGDKLPDLLHHLSPAMVEGGMEPVTLAGADLDALVAYLRVATASRGS